jgi:hypothetical protein
MAVSSSANGTQSATVGNEHTLTTQTTAGVYVLVVDLANLQNGDTVVLKLFTKYASGGTSRQAYHALYAHAQSNPVVYSIPVPVDTEIKATLEQTDGTSRNFYWNLLTL